MSNIKGIIVIFMLSLLFFSGTVFAGLNSGTVVFDPIQTVGNCTAGSIQYRPKSTCGTEERKCCGSGSFATWSEWGKPCSASSSCTSNQCWDGSKCVNKPSSGSCTCTNGTCKVTYSCSSGKGWQKSQTCTCKSGYQQSPYTGECVHSTCVQSCSSGSYRRQKMNSDQCECCFASCGLQGPNGLVGLCNCYTTISSGNLGRCCRRTSVFETYRLPSDFSTCQQLGKAAYNEDNGWSETPCNSLTW